MKKKNKKIGSMLKNPFVLAIPLTVALSLISSGTAFGATSDIQIEMLDGSKVKVNMGRIAADDSYRISVEAALKNAFNNGKELLVEYDDTGWIDFSGNAKEGLSYDMMLNDPASYSGDEDPSAGIY